MTTYRIEFGKVGETYPVPPITLEHTDPNEFARKVAAHAIPYLTPVLAEMGRPELADCFFRVDRNDPTYGDFLWIDLAANKGAQFCPARLTPVEPAAEEAHVVADDSDDPEHVDDCPGCAPAS
ncbi:hypothetical protein [Streptomyces griseoloalbus]|uniref:Uncharacterized protein n=1 Tax=Streptomyces griseoloalbus TaxID=67303 RepID=A0A7W8BVR2_9ACTN|nr:hypothetical protein [Streptomyces albaduncus]MBB5129777.1 hypothetical protein [Streptomyces albaduncus]GGW81994.1 hypothetical protein GCM10010340_69970 [Streptomyces albaduncus]